MSGQCERDFHYSGWVAENNDASNLEISGVIVSDDDVAWLKEFWTIFEDLDCTGGSALLPVAYEL